MRVALGVTASPADFAIDGNAVAFEGFRPYAELLDGIDLVVGHGGAGTNLGALAAGRPLALIPQGAVKRGSPSRVSSRWGIEAHGARKVYSTDATTRASHTACR